MNFREQMSKLRREYRTEASRLDKRLDELSDRTDSGFTRLSNEMRTMRDQVRALHDQLDASVETVDRVKADQKETSRTLQGRARLLEDRFGKMLDLVATTVEEAPTRVDLEDLAHRVEALEKKLESAA